VRSVFKPRVADLLLEEVKFVDEMFAGFIDGKIIDSAIIGVLCYIGCLIFKFPNALLISVIVGVTNVIPFFGPFIGAVPATLLIMLEDPIKGLWFILFVFVLQQLDGNIIGPKILGNSVGINGFWIMFAIIVMGDLFGVGGMIIGVPLFVVLTSAFEGALSIGLKKRGLSDEAALYVDMSHMDPETGVPVPKKQEQMTVGKKAPERSEKSTQSGE
jgi:predicted PurR-regulated permease PerM